MAVATVIIPHAFVARWLMICVASLKAYKNNASFDIIVVDGSVGHPSIRAIMETSLGEGVKIIQANDDPNLAGHQIALDRAIDLVDTKYFVAWETDVQVMRDGWLDYMISFVKDDYVAIVGWLWASKGQDDWRHYISPAGALYRTSTLKMLKEECLRNKDLAVCYGKDMSKRIDIAKDFPHTGGKLIPAGIWGPFLEARGFGNVYPYSMNRDYWVSEPGNWVYNRCKMQWECIHLPGELVVNDDPAGKGIPHKYSYAGPSDNEAYFRHYFAGTVSHNYQKHKIPPFHYQLLPFWLGREYRIWNEVVPLEARTIAVEKGLVKPYEEELAFAKSQVQG